VNVSTSTVPDMRLSARCMRCIPRSGEDVMAGEHACNFLFECQNFEWTEGAHIFRPKMRGTSHVSTHAYLHAGFAFGITWKCNKMVQRSCLGPRNCIVGSSGFSRCLSMVASCVCCRISSWLLVQTDSSGTRHSRSPSRFRLFSTVASRNVVPVLRALVEVRSLNATNGVPVLSCCISQGFRRIWLSSLFPHRSLTQEPAPMQHTTYIPAPHTAHSSPSDKDTVHHTHLA
jgi:hypothetical protein